MIFLRLKIEDFVTPQICSKNHIFIDLSMSSESWEPIFNDSGIILQNKKEFLICRSEFMELGSPLGWHGTVVYDFYEKLKCSGKNVFSMCFFQISVLENLRFVGDPVCLVLLDTTSSIQDFPQT